MTSLIPASQLQRLTIPGADISYVEQVDFGRPPAEIFDELRATTPWKHEEIRIRGRAIKQPRLTAWYGDPGCSYTYSGLAHSPAPWSPLLAQLKKHVEEITRTVFNSALLNAYRNGRDSVGYHADNEPELGPRPTIASLSFGEEREFGLRPSRGRSGRSHKIRLASGSLLIMAGDTQKNWLHGIEKVSEPCGPRINITFRSVTAAANRTRRFSR